MSLGWKKFSFFDKDDKGKSHEVPEHSTCATSGGNHLLFGCADGQVAVLDRAFQRHVTFEAHQLRVSHICFLQRQKLLVTLGRDDPSLGSVTVKVWNFDAVGRSGADPGLLRTVRVFSSRMPEAEVLALAIHEESWPQMTIAVGLVNGCVYLLRGDVGREKVQRTVLTVKPEGADFLPITGLAFHGEEGQLDLFVVTPKQTLVYDMKTQAKRVLDELGAEPGCTVLSRTQELAVGRPEAVYFYTPDGRGPCFVFDGRKHHLGWLRQYLVAVASTAAPGLPGTSAAAAGGQLQHTLQVYDLRNKLIASSLPLSQEPRHVVCEWGLVMVVGADGGLVCLKEKELSHKLELLFSKNLYLVALSLASSEEAEPSVIAEIQRRYGDHLYGKHDYDGAMSQYAATIGVLEPSYVIHKFLDAQRIHNLTSYLEALHQQGHAFSDHTTLLLNCYTKLKDVAKLDKFLLGSGGAGAGPGAGGLPFDVETAVKVCRAAGYYEHALNVALAAGEPEWYLDILLEDCGSYDEALVYLQGLPRQQAATALTRYGKALVNQRPEATTALLMQLCTAGEGARDGGWVAQVSDFAHLYADRPLALVLLCEFILNSSHRPEAYLYHTLLELYLSPELRGGGAAEALAADNTTAALHSQASREEQALELLRRGWPSGEEPHYDADHMLVVCRMHAFRDGLVFLYENMRLFREVLRVHMGAGDHAGLIEACMRLGDASRGGDPHLWNEVLEYFGAQQSDCTQQVKEVLGHIEEGGLLPPLVVLQTLAANPRLKLSVVKSYMARQLAAESSSIEADRAAIARYQAETQGMRAEVTELKTKARVFQNSKCAVSGSLLELPAVHFLCGHSFNLRSLGENDGECPLCAPGFRTILDIRRSMRAGAAEQDKFFTQLKNSADGFSVIAEFFGRGILNATAASRGAAGAAS